MIFRISKPLIRLGIRRAAFPPRGRLFATRHSGIEKDARDFIHTAVTYFGRKRSHSHREVKRQAAGHVIHCHAPPGLVEAPTPTKRTSPYPTLHLVQHPCRGSSKPLPYKSAHRFIVLQLLTPNSSLKRKASPRRHAPYSLRAVKSPLSCSCGGSSSPQKAGLFGVPHCKSDLTVLSQKNMPHPEVRHNLLFYRLRLPQPRHKCRASQ